MIFFFNVKDDHFQNFPLLCLTISLNLMPPYILMHSVVCVFIQTEELIKALQDLENAASGDATVRQKIASLPQEVQDVSLLEKITGEKVVWVKDEGRGTYLQCIKPQDMLMSAGTDFPCGIGFSVILGFANITHMLNKEAAGIVQA